MHQSLCFLLLRKPHDALACVLDRCMADDIHAIFIAISIYLIRCLDGRTACLHSLQTLAPSHRAQVFISLVLLIIRAERLLPHHFISSSAGVHFIFHRAQVRYQRIEKPHVTLIRLTCFDKKV